MVLSEWLKKIKPSVPKRGLLLAAACFWAIAGAILMIRGIHGIKGAHGIYGKITISVIAGLIFFILLFIRISAKHIRRILSIDILRPCVFSFFDFRSYILIAIMITAGIFTGKINIIPHQTVSFFLITMAMPLLLSSFWFLLSFIQYHRIIQK